MSEYYKSKNELPAVSEKMIFSTIQQDWKEFHDRDGMNAYATSKRIISELGSFLTSQPNIKLKSLMLLRKLVDTYSPNNLEAIRYLRNEINEINQKVDKETARNQKDIDTQLNEYV